VALSGASNAVIVDSQGVGTILNDDPLPTVTINDALPVVEGAIVHVSVSLSAPSGRTVTVDLSTADGTAVAPGDYVSTSGSVTFPAGTVDRTFNVITNRDGLTEPAENFYVVVRNVVNAGVADGLAVCSIRRSGELGGGPALDRAGATLTPLR
jgi:hypothetical protein